MGGPAVATTIVVAGGDIVMDGHRPIEYDAYVDNQMIPTRQLRATDSEGNIVELALSKHDVQNIIDVLELYR